MANYYSVIRIFFVAVCTAATNSSGCDIQNPPIMFDQKMCHNSVTTTTWYQYGSSEPCENCCRSRRFVGIEKSGRINVIDKIKNENDTFPTVEKFYFKADPANYYIYYKDNGPHPFVVLESDCKSYFVLYEPHINKLDIFSPKFNLDHAIIKNAKSIIKCNMKIYKHNPSLECK